MMTVWHGFLRLFITSSTFLSLNTTTMMDFEAQECLPMLISFLFVRSLWHSQAGDSIPKFNRWISNFMSLNIFSTWDNIWLFNGATYFMKSTNKYFVTSRAHHKKSQFYWNPIINKSSFVDVTMIVFEMMMMTSFPPRKTDWVVRRCSAPQKHSIDGAKKEKGQRESVQSFIELDSKFIFALVHQNKLAGPKITKNSIREFRVQVATHTLTKRISWRFNFYLFSLLIYLCKVCLRNGMLIKISTGFIG